MTRRCIWDNIWCLIFFYKCCMSYYYLPNVGQVYKLLLSYKCWPIVFLNTVNFKVALYLHSLLQSYWCNQFLLCFVLLYHKRQYKCQILWKQAWVLHECRGSSHKSFCPRLGWNNTNTCMTKAIMPISRLHAKFWEWRHHYNWHFLS